MFNSNDLPHELFLTQRQITKLRNAIGNNMSSDTKLSKVQIKKYLFPADLWVKNRVKNRIAIIKISCKTT